MIVSFQSDSLQKKKKWNKKENIRKRSMKKSSTHAERYSRFNWVSESVIVRLVFDNRFKSKMMLKENGPLFMFYASFILLSSQSVKLDSYEN